MVICTCKLSQNELFVNWDAIQKVLTCSAHAGMSPTALALGFEENNMSISSKNCPDYSSFVS